MGSSVTITPDPVNAGPVTITPDTPMEHPYQSWLDREIPLTSYGAATEQGIQSIARGGRDLAEGLWSTVRHPIQTAEGVAQLPSQVAQVPAAIHDIDQSADPLGTYAKVGQKTAGQGAAQALGALATEGVVKGAPAALDAAKSYSGAVQPIASAIYKTLDAATFDRVGKIWNAWKNLPEEVRAKGPQFSDPGAPLPEAPPKELIQARALGGQSGTPAEPAAALGTLPAPAVHQALQELGAGASTADLTDRASQIASGSTIPRTLNGDSALRQVLTGQDNANLLKIARSRGINVSQEAQLKPGVADNPLINKIVNDFGPDELDDIRDQYLENSRFRHAFGNIGPEAWKTMSLQTYFPDLKIPATRLARTQKAISAAPSNADDLTGILQQSLAQAKARQ